MPIVGGKFTKLLLGVNVALPAAILCIARELELVTSYRKISTDQIVIRNRMILELVLCYVVPVTYMSLHIVIQDRRFDLVRDYGCSASSHPSTVAFLILWLPPLIIGAGALVLSGITIRNIGNIRGTSVNAHVESRSTSMNSSIVTRRLVTCMVIAIASVLIRLASLFTISSFQSWTSLREVHRLMFKIEVVKVPADVTNFRFNWWSLLVISVLYLILAFAIGEEARDIYRWVWKEMKKERHMPHFSLPLYHRKKDAMKRFSLESKPQMKPLTLDLKSGWDDTFTEKMRSKAQSLKSNSESTSPAKRSSRTASSLSLVDEDVAFMVSTLSYLGSPTAKTLGIAPPLQITSSAPAPTASSLPFPQPIAVPLRPASPPFPTAERPLLRAMPSAYIPVDVEPDVDAEINIKSVLDEPWPIPPLSPASSRSISQYSCSSSPRSRSNSPASSPTGAVESFGYALYPTVTPPHRRTRPFEGSSISSFEIDPTVPITPPRKSSMKRHATIINLKRKFSKDNLGPVPPFGNSEVIRMTVVRETV
ncbi:hypothetical protein D9613_002290 [Agrocybe pediades]|uniref:Pheromone receptor n=1 Tax=Agrocybe pediades TaxID=84607 RepID=A0A8H4R5J7_9AGAR|nr:hypothetical protein D9613_002290 [Agrocybe pediades]